MFLLINGVSFIFFALTSFTLLGDKLTSYLPYLLIFTSFPHFILTYLIWAKRVTSWKEEWWPIVFPLCYGIAFFLSFKIQAEFFCPELLVKFSYYYLLYHFAQQLYGVTLWLCYAQGVTCGKVLKIGLRSFFLVGAVYAMLDLELRGATSVLFYLPSHPMTFPSELLIVGFVLAGLLFFFVLILNLKDYLTKKSLSSFIPMIGVATGALWFIPPFSHGMVFFLPVIHALQYFPFIYIKNKELTLIKWGVVGLLSLLTGWFVFRWVPFSGRNLVSVDYWPVWPAFILTLFNNHHFIIDGRIWKLRDPVNKDLLSEVPGYHQKANA